MALHNWTLDDFELGRPLGRGKFGQVWLARERKRGYIVALKILIKSEIESSENLRQIRREIEIHAHLKCENILRMYGYFHDSTKIYLILEYAGGGELFRILQTRRRFDEKTSALFIFQVARSLKYMHEHRIIHRDLKPENILIGSDGALKIADFGWAVRNIDMKRYTFCGTMEYLAPEIIKNDIHNKFVDLWCLGILCYEFLVGTPPFEASNRNYREAYRKIRELDYTIPQTVSAAASKFIRSLLVIEPHDRLKLEDIPRHPWIISNVDLSERERY
jgi:aurora kinase